MLVTSPGSMKTLLIWVKWRSAAIAHSFTPNAGVVYANFNACSGLAGIARCLGEQHRRRLVFRFCHCGLA